MIASRGPCPAGPRPVVGKRSVLPITAIRFNPDSTSQRDDRSIVAISGNTKSLQKCLLNWSYVAPAALLS